MWVRAMDLYAKIFKSIEPKRIRLLQSESELALAMAALREETDRVAHIESTITSIQSSYQVRQIRRKKLNIMRTLMNDRPNPNYLTSQIK
jgi:dynein heavy chain